jgi:hypothetical protein
MTQTTETPPAHFAVRDPARPSEPYSAVRVTHTQGIDVLPEGLGLYGMLPGDGGPIYLERYDGVWKLHVWADINQEDPTHTIDLSGASETLRRPD